MGWDHVSAGCGTSLNFTYMSPTDGKARGHVGMSTWGGLLSFFLGRQIGTFNMHLIQQLWVEPSVLFLHGPKESAHDAGSVHSEQLSLELTRKGRF